MTTEQKWALRDKLRKATISREFADAMLELLDDTRGIVTLEILIQRNDEEPVRVFQLGYHNG